MLLQSGSAKDLAVEVLTQLGVKGGDMERVISHTSDLWEELRAELSTGELASSREKMGLLEMMDPAGEWLSVRLRVRASVGVRVCIRDRVRACVSVYASVRSRSRVRARAMVSFSSGVQG